MVILMRAKIIHFAKRKTGVGSKPVSSEKSKMRWITALKDLSGLSLREFADKCDTKHNRLSQIVSRDSENLNMLVEFICKARKVVGLSWSQIGKMLDKIYLGK